MQMWFDTPAFLVDLFRRVNPEVELVSSDPVMDPLRMIKEPEELACLAEAQRIAGLGMDRVRELLFVPTRCEEDWLTDHLQILLGKLTQAAGIGEQMPDYSAQPAKAAADVVFPVSFIGRDKPT